MRMLPPSIWTLPRLMVIWSIRCVPRWSVDGIGNFLMIEQMWVMKNKEVDRMKLSQYNQYCSFPERRKLASNQGRDWALFSESRMQSAVPWHDFENHSWKIGNIESLRMMGSQIANWCTQKQVEWQIQSKRQHFIIKKEKVCLHKLWRVMKNRCITTPLRWSRHQWCGNKRKNGRQWRQSENDWLGKFIWLHFGMQKACYWRNTWRRNRM